MFRFFVGGQIYQSVKKGEGFKLPINKKIALVAAQRVAIELGSEKTEFESSEDTLLNNDVQIVVGFA